MTFLNTISQIIFFIGLVLLYLFLSMYSRDHNFSNLTIIAISLIIVLSIYGYIKIINPFKSCESYCENTNLLEISPAKRCRGGPYTWQGNSERAKMCRKLASTRDGMNLIKSYQCSCGFIGLPKRPFKFTPESNDNWENTRCSGLLNENQMYKEKIGKDVSSKYCSGVF
jgi:hypothetical protein